MLEIALGIALVKFVCEAAGAQTSGQVAYHELSRLYRKIHGKSLVDLQVKAFKEAVDSWSPTLNRLGDASGTVRVDEKELRRILTRRRIPVPSDLSIRRSDLVPELVTSIERILIIPGHMLNTDDLDRLASRLLEITSTMLTEEIAKDDDLFRLTMLEASRRGASDDHRIVELLEDVRRWLKQSSMAHTRGEYSALGLSSAEDLRKACQLSAERAVSGLAKYDPGVYVDRRGPKRIFDQFLAAPNPCMLVQGEAGIGKTNLLCHLANESAVERPTLFLRGTARISNHLGVHRLIADELAVATGRSLDPAAIVTQLDHLLARSSASMVIFIDGINENPDTQALKESLAYAVRDLANTRIKLCFSCRDVDWRMFADEKHLTSLQYEPRHAVGAPSRGLLMTPFTERELKQAWRKYSVKYKLTGRLTPHLADICRNPLMLQFIADAFSGASVPTGIRRKEVFDRYWEQKILVRGRRSLENSISSVARQMLERQSAELSEHEVVAMIGESHYQDLLSEQVIIYTYLDQVLGQNMVGFTYDAFLEYAMAREVRRAWMQYSLSDDELHVWLLDLLRKAEEFRLLQGVVLYLILFLGRPNVVKQQVAHLVQGPATWRVFACELVTKLEQEDTVGSLLPLLVRLADDESVQVRWAFGHALGLLASRFPDIGHAWIQRLAAGEEWKQREVASFAVARGVAQFQEAVTLLAELGDDINWRVRRAAGHALNGLWEMRPNKTYTLLASWTSADNWRLRQAVAKSQNWPFVSPSRSFSLLEKLAADDHPEVRWLVVMDLVFLCWHRPLRREVMQILLVIAVDSERVVRKHIATWIPDLYGLVGDAVAPLVEQLASDCDRDVRWEMARCLRRVPESKIRRATIRHLLNDPDPKVSFAALVTDRTGRDTGDVAVESSTSSGSRQIDELQERIATASHFPKESMEGLDFFGAWRGDRYARVIDAIAVEAIRQSTADVVREFYTALSFDEDEGIRWALSGTVVDSDVLSPEQKLRIIAVLCHDDHYWVRREAVTSLAWLAEQGEDDAELTALVGLALKGCEDENPEVRFASLSCLLALGQAGFIPIRLRNRLRADPDRQLSALAARIPS